MALLRVTLPFREIEVRMAARGFDVPHETICSWCARFGSELRPTAGDKAPTLNAEGNRKVLVAWGSVVAGPLY